MEPLSNISKDDFLRLNELAFAEGPAAKQNLNDLLAELSRANGSERLAGCERGILVLTGQAIPSSSSYASVECILDFPSELQHPAEQASACVNLLGRIERDGVVDTPPPRYTADQIQRRLSKLLVDYPILMDGRVLFAVNAPNPDWATMPGALAELSFASLPSPSHGFSERELRLFASRSCVKSGLTRAVMQSNSKASLLRKRTPLEIADKDRVQTYGIDETRGAFLTSLLRLSHYARLMTGRAVLHFSAQDPTRGDALYKQLSQVFWDVATNDGKNSGITAAEFVAAMKLPSPFLRPPAQEAEDPELDQTIATAGIRASEQAPSALQYQLALRLDGALFGVFEASPNPPTVFNIHNQEAMFRRTSGAIDLLVAIGAYETHEAAAKWLARATVGVTRMQSGTAGPGCTHEGAMGFLAAIGQHGVEASLAGPTQSALPANPTPVQLRVENVWRTWESAIRIHGTLSTMRDVIAKSTSEPAPAPTSRPRSLRQRV